MWEWLIRGVFMNVNVNVKYMTCVATPQLDARGAMFPRIHADPLHTTHTLTRPCVVARYKPSRPHSFTSPPPLLPSNPYLVSSPPLWVSTIASPIVGRSLLKSKHIQAHFRRMDGWMDAVNLELVLVLSETRIQFHRWDFG